MYYAWSLWGHAFHCKRYVLLPFPMDWNDELFETLLMVAGYFIRPDVHAAFLESANIKLDRALFPLFVRIGLAAPISLVDLAGMIGRDQSTVSRQVAVLERHGLIDRTPSSDGRVRLLAPTIEGQTLLSEIASARRGFLETKFAGWPESQRKDLVRFMKALVKALDPINTGSSDKN